VTAFCIFINVYYIAEKEAVFLYNKGFVNHEMANKFNELHGKRIIFNSIFRFSFTVHTYCISKVAPVTELLSN
jgi:hypothetical protein